MLVQRNCCYALGLKRVLLHERSPHFFAVGSVHFCMAAGVTPPSSRKSGSEPFFVDSTARFGAGMSSTGHQSKLMYNSNWTTRRGSKDHKVMQMSNQDNAVVNLNNLLNQLERRVSASDELTHSITFDHLDESNNVFSYLARRGSSYKSYKHYATRERIESILGGQAIYLTDGSSWNDTFDSRRFNPQFSANKKFGICLSVANGESIAMWMLYGGRDGNGAMIDFDKETLQDAMNQPEYDLGRFENGAFVTVKTLPADCIKLSLLEVLYFKEAGHDMLKIKRAVGRDKTACISRRALSGIEEIAKHDSWAYEREVRLVAKVSMLELTGRQSGIQCIRLPLELSDDFINNRVYDSPVSDNKGRFLDSALRGTIEWNLCSGCNRLPA